MTPLPIIPVNDEARMPNTGARIDTRIRNASLLATYVFLFATAAKGQIQVDLKFQRLQYIAYKPVVATVTLTNLAGRDIELHDANGQSWLGFEITGSEDQPITLLSTENAQPALKIEGGQRVTQQVDLGSLFPVHDFGAYQDKDTGIVYATYSLGRSIVFEQPQTEIDRANQLHVLHCAAPRAWSYSRIGLNGELLTHSSFLEAKTRPRPVHSANGEVAVRGGVADTTAQSSRTKAPKLSARPPGLPKDDQ